MSHSGTSPGNLGQAGQAAAWLAQGLAALDDRLLKARSEQFTVKAAGDLAFIVQNGDGVDYVVEFKTIRTGTCTCPDFAKRGKSLGTCKHILRAVVVNWPERLEPYLELVRAHIRQTVERHASKNGAAGQGQAEPGNHQPGRDPDAPDEPAAPEQGDEGRVPTAMPGQGRIAAASPEPGDRQTLAQTAMEAMLDATMQLVQETMPEITQRMVEELFARLMERAPELFEEALRKAIAAQDSPQGSEAEA